MRGAGRTFVFGSTVCAGPAFGEPFTGAGPSVWDGARSFVFGRGVDAGRTFTFGCGAAGAGRTFTFGCSLGALRTFGL